jgi:serine/threonine protein kinase
MNRCRACGFDNVEAGKPCPSCKAVDGAHLHELETIARPLTSVGFGKLAEAIYPNGTIYAKRYRIVDFLGRGGMGSVYKVVDTQDNREMALKILHKETASESEGSERFKREIEILSKMNHASVPKVYGWGFNTEQQFDNEPYFVAEYIDGQDLKSIIREKGPWQPADAAALVAKIADVLSMAHSKGIIHRDVKPQNIMIPSDNSVKLLDFGVARNKGAGMETLTQTGMIVGTPEYMSPEQFGTNKVDERSDVYSLGVVLFELLTGRVPFDGGTPVAIALKVVDQAPVAPREVRPDTPAWIERIVMQCLEKDPKKRYWTAADLAADLRKVRTGQGPRRHWLPSGDAVIEDDSGSTDWALVLLSAKEKPEWIEGIGMRFAGRLYKLGKILLPEIGSSRWQYCFTFWPDQEVFRQLIDYEAYITQVKAKQEVKESFAHKMKKRIFG